MLLWCKIGFLNQAPLFVVETISTNDSFEKSDQKMKMGGLLMVTIAQNVSGENKTIQLPFLKKGIIL